MALLSLIYSTERRLKIGTLEVDVSESESHQSSLAITQNPVEDGVDITDHMQRLPERLTINGIVSDTPIKFFQGLRSLGGSKRTEIAYVALKQIQEEKTLVDISTGFKQYFSMALTELTVPRDVSQGSLMRFSATFVEVVTVESEEVLLPQSVGGATVNKGKVPAKGTSRPEPSILSKITGLK
jgi:hypothetical protein